jgi:outer membrane scaffolding protein for murein synthesis (MipA/OmpV family)
MRKESMKKTILMAVCIVAALTLGAKAEDGHKTEDHHHGHKHHVAVFFGGTHDYHDENAFTLGLDYEYRLTELLGAGALIDYAGGDIESAVIGGGLFIHPWQDLRFLTAVGKEIHNGHNEFLVRLGVMYDFHLEGWTLSPTINVDLLESDHQNVVYGIAFGRGF